MAALVAIETKKEIRCALRDWEALLEPGALEIEGLGGKVLWNERLGFWSLFGRSIANTPQGWRYWNAFGTRPSNFRQSIVVEVNPPQSGPAKGSQGVVARRSDGTRVVLHRGRLHPQGVRVTEEMYAAAVSTTPLPVLFSDGRSILCYPVTELDAGRAASQTQTAAFVQQCELVRLRYILSVHDQELQQRVEEAEWQSTPEAIGTMCCRRVSRPLLSGFMVGSGLSLSAA